MLEQLNALLDRAERATWGQRLLTSFVAAAASIGTVALSLGPGASEARAQTCNVCCWGYRGYRCNEWPKVVSTTKDRAYFQG
jgi:hypothetical protein